ncbi:MAG: hypothetical protein ABEI98_02725 [Halorhabdus sp.]
MRATEPEHGNFLAVGGNLLLEEATWNEGSAEIVERLSAKRTPNSTGLCIDVGAEDGLPREVLRTGL